MSKSFLETETPEYAYLTEELQSNLRIFNLGEALTSILFFPIETTNYSDSRGFLRIFL